MNSEKAVTIQADYMYLIFLGDNDIIDKIVDKLNKNNEKPNNEKTILNKDKSVQSNKNKQQMIYIKCEINNPCINMIEEDHIQKILTDDALKQIEILKTKNKNFCNRETKNIETTDSDIDSNKKYIKLDEGVETAQCLTYADVTSNDATATKRKTPGSKLVMVMVMIKNDSCFTLSYPILQLDQEENPDKLISKWLKDNNLKNIVRELTIRPVHIVGNEHDILVFSAFVNE
jgi:hypothetical protein